MFQGTAVCIMWHLCKLSPKQHNFKENYLCYLYWGGEKKKKKKCRFIFTEHLLLELNDWTVFCIPFPLNLSSAAVGPPDLDCDMYPTGL